MLIGYVSDERYVALPDVMLEFLQGGRSIEARSRASGAVYAELSPGACEAVLYKQGYGSKRVQFDVQPDQAYQFRLLSDGLLGYVWPKWVKTGEEGEFRVHSVEAYQLELWRYGAEKEFVRNPRLARRARPARHDADHARRRLHADGRRLEQARLQHQGPSPDGPGAGTERAVLLSRPHRLGPALLISLDRGAGQADQQTGACWHPT